MLRRECQKRCYSQGDSRGYGFWFDPEGDPGHHDNQAGWNVGVKHKIPENDESQII